MLIQHCMSITCTLSDPDFLVRAIIRPPDLSREGLKVLPMNFLFLSFIVNEPFRRTRPTCALCSKVMLVISIYILNVVVKQAISVTSQENKTGDILCVTYSRVKFITRYCTFTHVRTHLYIKVDNLKIIHKKVSVSNGRSLYIHWF